MDGTQNQYLRLKNTETFAIYTGSDIQSRKSLYVKLVKKPRKIRSSKYIEAQLVQREDKRFGLTVSLCDESYRGVFDAFVQDLLDAIQLEDNELLAEEKFLKRLDLWWSLFARRVESVLSFERIFGLMGELIFLKDYIIPKYGAEYGLKGWTGPLGADQDFSLGKTWYEVKTKSIDKPSIHISNASQLTEEGDGYLIVNSYSKTSASSDNGTNIMKLYDELCRRLVLPELIALFNKQLAMAGFVPKEQYEETIIEFKRTDFYAVNNDFPMIKTADNQPAISRIEYDLAVNALSMYKVDDINEQLSR
ncbi:PD-(D/E)XK motif protein [Lacticaseibacillus porcinae]|uniref:PD-(D/E)XK motif protein n=1 Tax=Lacticaseibacillus porcinae TaxID=1123687 RepID=UPI000F7B82C5|nr:PD-(D/E)XK motif protein [Lacticaseibacillus porcinae]